MVLPERFACQGAAVEAAKRYVSLDHERLLGALEPVSGDTRAHSQRVEAKRRQFARIPVTLPIIGRAPQFREMSLPGMVRSISPGGLMVEFSVVVVPGSILRVALQTGLGRLEVEGRVVWTALTRGAVRHGLAFPEPRDPESYTELFDTDSTRPGGRVAKPAAPRRNSTHQGVRDRGHVERGAGERSDESPRLV